jgi:hypothetical protein
LSERPIRFEHKRHRFLQICSRFLQRRTLRVYAWQLLDEADIALGHFPKYGRELQVHSWLQQL